mmetsp:Transcript_10649/g.16034  ORF Transcript_10649/g.16034 Transcript_10649/m.16034 type:complete len:244 (-) Transcript_10649:197-928(-)
MLWGLWNGGGWGLLFLWRRGSAFNLRIELFQKFVLFCNWGKRHSFFLGRSRSRPMKGRRRGRSSLRSNSRSSVSLLSHRWIWFIHPPITAILLDLVLSSLSFLLGLPPLALLNHLIQALVLAVHFQILVNLLKGDFLSVTTSDNFIKCKTKIISLVQNILFFRDTTKVSCHFVNEFKCLQIFQDVGRFVGDQQHIKLLQGCVQISNRISFQVRVVFVCTSNKLGKGRQQPLNSEFRDVLELTS